jgi:hypothetical protein
MIFVAMLGGGLAAYGGTWSHAQQRAREAELVWIGNQFREAIGLYYQRTPGAAKRFPARLEDLLDDRRMLSRQRYLRRVYRDPLTGDTDWGLIEAPGGGIAGVYSLASGSSLGGVRLGSTYLPNGVSYRDWRFVYVPPS